VSKLRSFFLYRLLATYVLCPLWLLGFRLAARVRGVGRLRVGKLSVWGDAGFLALSKSSIERVGHLDPELHRVLTQEKRQTVDWSRAEAGLALTHETKSTQMRFRPFPLCALCALRS
jgi:hypothetical protein